MGKPNALALVVVAACQTTDRCDPPPPTGFVVDVVHPTVVPGEVVEFSLVDECSLGNAGDCWSVGSIMVVGASGSLELDGSDPIGRQTLGVGTFDVSADYVASIFKPPIGHSTETTEVTVALPDSVTIESPCLPGLAGDQVPTDIDLPVSWTLVLDGDERDGFLDPNPLTASSNLAVLDEALRDRTATYHTPTAADAMLSLLSSTGNALSLRTYDPQTATYEVAVYLGSILDLQDPTKLYMDIDLASHQACIVPQGQLENLTPTICRLDTDATLHGLMAGTCQIKATLRGTTFSKVFDFTVN